MCYAECWCLQKCLVKCSNDVFVFLFHIYPLLEICPIQVWREQCWAWSATRRRQPSCWGHWEAQFSQQAHIIACSSAHVTQGPWHENATDQKWRHASGWNNQFAFPWEVNTSNIKIIASCNTITPTNMSYHVTCLAWNLSKLENLHLPLCMSGPNRVVFL